MFLASSTLTTTRVLQMLVLLVTTQLVFDFEEHDHRDETSDKSSKEF